MSIHSPHGPAIPMVTNVISQRSKFHPISSISFPSKYESVLTVSFFFSITTSSYCFSTISGLLFDVISFSFTILLFSKLFSFVKTFSFFMSLSFVKIFFLVSSIKSSLKKSSYADQISSTKLPNLLINLPITPNNQPDWNYMECYMRQCEEVVSSKISYMNEIITGDVAERIDISSWKKFHLYDDCLFTIDSGTKLDKVKMTNNNPSVNFVGRSNANNGVTDYIDEIEGIKPYDAGCLTISLGGEYLGSCFIQDKPFYTSQNVNVLIPKHNMSDYCKRFIATMIFKEGRLRYKAFIDELNRHIRTDFSILLPVTNSGTPDWKYMERYMKRVEEKTKIALRTLIQ